MLSTKDIKTIPLNRENILKYVTEEQIFRKYIPHDFEINTETFHAPYRVDKRPSFGIYYNTHFNKLMFKDLSTKDGGDCFKYVSKIFNCNLWQACIRINEDFNLKLGINTKPNKLIEINDSYKKERIRKEITIKEQEFTDIDINYWKQYSISLDTLKLYNIHSCYEFYVNNEFRRRYTKNYPIYAYYFPRTNNYKIYIPNANKYEKWFTNASNDWDIQGYDQLPETGELIFITKSMKDCMVLYELGYNAVATHGEAHWFNPDFIRHLRDRFKKLIIFYDEDEAGHLCANKISEEYNIEKFFTNDIHNKDISDYVRNRGKEEARILLQNI